MSASRDTGQGLGGDRRPAREAQPRLGMPGQRGSRGLGEPGLLPADSAVEVALGVHPLLMRMMGLHLHLAGRGGNLARAAAG